MIFTDRRSLFFPPRAKRNKQRKCYCTSRSLAGSMRMRMLSPTMFFGRKRQQTHALSQRKSPGKARAKRFARKNGSAKHPTITVPLHSPPETSIDHARRANESLHAIEWFAVRTVPVSVPVRTGSLRSRTGSIVVGH